MKPVYEFFKKPIVRRLVIFCLWFVAGLFQLFSLGIMAGSRYVLKLKCNWMEKTGFFLFLIITIFISSSIAFYLLVQSRRLKTFSAEQVLEYDSHPPILYLHSFKDDHQYKSEHISYEDPRLSSVFTLEEEIAFAFFYAGPMVAIGNPKEKIPHAGAFRTYQSEVDWQQYIIDMLEKSKLVIVRVRDTASIRWEVNESIKRLRPEQLILIELKGPKTYQSFEGWLQTTCGHPVFREVNIKSGTKFRKWLDKLSDETLGDVILFEDDFRPRAIPIQKIANCKFTSKFLEPKQSFAYSLFTALTPYFLKHNLLTRSRPVYKKTMVDHIAKILLILTALLFITVIIIECNH